MDVELYSKTTAGLVSPNSLFGESTGLRCTDRVKFSGFGGEEKWVAVSRTKPSWFSRIWSPVLEMAVLNPNTNAKETIWINKSSFKKRFSTDEKSAAFLVSKMPELRAKVQSLYGNLQTDGIDFKLQWKLSEKEKRIQNLEAVLKPHSPEIKKEQIKKICEDADRESLTEPGVIRKIISTFGVDKSEGRSILLGPNGEKFLLLTHVKNNGDKILGEGSFKKAKIAINLDTYEVKAVVIAKSEEEFDNSEKERLELEIAMMNLVKEIPETVKLDFSFHQPPADDVKEKYYFIMDYCEGGDLDQKLKNSVNGEERNRWLLNIANGLQSMHNAGIIHRDLKPANIFLKDGQAKIADFGLSCKDNTKAPKEFGTLRYRAPESYNPGYISTKKNDSWAYGCLVYESFAEERFIPGVKTRREVKTYICGLSQDQVDEKINGNEKIPTEFKDILKKLLSVDPLERCDMTTAVQELTRIFTPLHHIYQSLREQIGEKLRVANKLGKPLLILAGERHKLKESMILNLMIAQISKELSIDKYLVESKELDNVDLYRSNDISLRFAHIIGMNAVPCDPLNSLGASEEDKHKKERQLAMNKAIHAIGEHSVMVVGAAHLHPICNDDSIKEKYELLVLDVAQIGKLNRMDILLDISSSMRSGIASKNDLWDSPNPEFAQSILIPTTATNEEKSSILRRLFKSVPEGKEPLFNAEAMIKKLIA